MREGSQHLGVFIINRTALTDFFVGVNNRDNKKNFWNHSQLVQFVGKILHATENIHCIPALSSCPNIFVKFGKSLLFSC